MALDPELSGEVASLEKSLELMGALSNYWFLCGCWTEGRRLCRQLLDSTEQGLEKSPSRGRVYNLNGNLAFWQGDYEHARASHESSLGIRRAIGDTLGISNSLNNLGNVAERLGDYREGERSLRGEHGSPQGSRR